MTRIGSLLVWLGDFLRRCFAKSYIVEAQGDFLGVHDFRTCGNCGAYQDYLTPKAPKISRCPKCDAVVLIDGEYKHKGKKDRYVLNKTLYSRRVAFITMFWISLTIFWYLVLFKHVPFVPGEVKWLRQFMLFFLLPPLMFAVSFFLAVFMDKKGVREFHRGSWLFVLLWVLYFTVCVFYSEKLEKFVFRWENPPTKAEWEAHQDKLAIAEFEKLEGVEKLEFALLQRNNHPGSHEWSERAYSSFSSALREDFPKTLALRSEHPGITIPRDDVYMAYGGYLSHLAENNRYELAHQCNDDPSNLQSFSSLSEYAEFFAPCRTLDK